MAPGNFPPCLPSLARGPLTRRRTEISQADAASKAAEKTKQTDKAYARLSSDQKTIVDRAMKYAHQGDFQNGIHTFVSDRDKADETVKPNMYVILATHENSAEKFRQLLVDFAWNE